MKPNKDYFKGRNTPDRKAMPEQILCAAIWYKEFESPSHNVINIDKGVVVCGHRHGHCIGIMKSLANKRTVTFAPDAAGEHEQGFLTNKNRFVDRKEAAKIAIAAEQCIEGIETLYSEDLY